MVLSTLLISVIVAFLITFWATPYFIRFFNRIGVFGTDFQKEKKPVIPLSGGIPVFIGFMIGVMVFVAINVFVDVKPDSLDLLPLFAAVLSTSIIALIGFFDDINVRTKRVAIGSDAIDYKIGLKQWQKPLLTLLAAIPLMAVNSGVSDVVLPILGTINLGLFYPLLLIPIAVVCVSNATNMLAGMNGLETGMMAVASGGLTAYLLANGEIAGAVISGIGCASLLAFLFYNWSPAKMFPGDSLTYFSGAMFVSAVIIGNVEKFGILIFTPWIIEAILKLRGKFKVRSYGDLQKGGWIKAPYQKIYSLTHLAMKLNQRLGLYWSEAKVVAALIAFEAVIVLISAVLTKPV